MTSLVRIAALVCCLAATNAFGASVLFVGNSFTFGAGAQVMRYQPRSVTDLNGEGFGGVPALFKSFAVQAGLDYEVYLETRPGAGLDWHLDKALDKIGGRRWDTVVLQSYSTLDAKQPGDATMLIGSVKRMAEFLQQKNPAVDVRLMATWSRADQTYKPGGHWYGKGIDAMANDVRAGYDKAAAASSIVKGVIPVGEAWGRAMRSGFADANPYDGIERGKVNLWARDHYHASNFGYYLEALTVFGSITGRDPRSLGAGECAGADLGITPAQVRALEQIAFEQLSAGGTVMAPLGLSRPAAPGGCAALR